MMMMEKLMEDIGCCALEPWSEEAGRFLRRVCLGGPIGFEEGGMYMGVGYGRS